MHHHDLAKEKIDRIILNYFIQEGYQDAALSFAKETNTNLLAYDRSNSTNASAGFLKKLSSSSSNTSSGFTNMVQARLNQKTGIKTDNGSVGQSPVAAGYATIDKRREIKYLILRGEITGAIQKISDYFPKVLDSNNLLHFKLLRLNLIEMIRYHKLGGASSTDVDRERTFLDAVLKFVRENLINKVTHSPRLLKELEITMSLLCFNFDPSVKNIEDQADLPDELRSLFNIYLRNLCYRVVNKAILDLEDNDGLRQDNSAEPSSHYRGPRYMDVHLEALLLQKRPLLDELRSDDDDDMFKDDNDHVDYNYDVGLEENFAASSTERASPAIQQDDCIQDGLNELQDLSLESRLERIVKLWALTEQRLQDLNASREAEVSFDWLLEG